MEGFCAKTRSNQLEDSVGRWQLASRNTVQPTDQRLHGMTASSLSVLSIQPSSQVSRYIAAYQILAAAADYLTCMLMRKTLYLGVGRQETLLLMLAVCLSHTHTERQRDYVQ